MEPSQVVSSNVSRVQDAPSQSVYSLSVLMPFQDDFAQIFIIFHPLMCLLRLVHIKDRIKDGDDTSLLKMGFQSSDHISDQKCLVFHRLATKRG
mmetsp:Transcript_2159/g.3893  ORF Transcript_2159/g.3893 Transcript_2159/m.3893 type:complete len:94 (-) Transcript_2159:568-849(-)